MSEAVPTYHTNEMYAILSKVKKGQYLNLMSILTFVLTIKARRELDIRPTKPINRKLIPIYQKWTEIKIDLYKRQVNSS